MRSRRPVPPQPEPQHKGTSPAPRVVAVVVGVARDERSDPALEWAAAEAAARDVPLRIVHAYWIPLLADPWGALSVPPQSHSAAGAARQVLNNATVHARAVAPDLQVSTLAYRGSVPDAMVLGGTDGVVHVLGSSVATGTRWRRRRTPSDLVADRGQVPLVVVSLAGHQTSGPSRGRVVVGVGDGDGRHVRGYALAYAFDAARRRRTGVTAVHAWTPACTDRLLVEHALTERNQQELLRRTVAPYRDAFPDVDVRERALPEGARAALVDESDGATLLVVGSRPRRWLGRPRSGHVRRAVLADVRAPVVVVPDPASAPPQSWWSRLAPTRAPGRGGRAGLRPHALDELHLVAILARVQLWLLIAICYQPSGRGAGRTRYRHAANIFTCCSGPPLANRRQDASPCV